MVVNIIYGYVFPFILLVIAGYLIKTFRDEKVIKWVGIAVGAAEQMFKGDGRGKEKYAYVEKWISEKFNISPDELTNIIEGAVFELNSNKKRGVGDEQ